MGLFGVTSPFDELVEKATSEKNTSENWGDIMEICDKIGSSSRQSKECLNSIIRRLNHSDPHVAVQAITLLDACIINCGKSFHLEIASREFETEFRKLIARVQPQVAMKLKLSLKKWAENDFKSDPELNLIPSLYLKLRTTENHDFTDTSAAPPKQAPALIKDPNFVSSQKEQDDIAMAIELSLKEKGGRAASPKQATTATTYASLYPSMNGGPSAASAPSTRAAAAAEPRKVRALYDFEAAEDNELTFMAGEIIHVIDDSDPNWWKGYNQRGEGLFPSNFVSADLSVEPERLDVASKKANADAADAEAAAKAKMLEAAIVEIDENKIDRLLHLLHEANPEDPSQDSDEMLQLEAQVNQMLPLIDTELERVDRKHAQLTQLSSDLVEAINLYHTLMREPDRAQSAYAGYTTLRHGSAGQQQQQQLPNGMYSGMYHAQAGGFPSLEHNMQAMSLASAGMLPPHMQMMSNGYRGMMSGPPHLGMVGPMGQAGHPGIMGAPQTTSMHHSDAARPAQMHQQQQQQQIPTSHSMMAAPAPQSDHTNIPVTSMHQMHPQSAPPMLSNAQQVGSMPPPPISGAAPLHQQQQQQQPQQHQTPTSMNNAYPMTAPPGGYYAPNNYAAHPMQMNAGGALPPPVSTGAPPSTAQPPQPMYLSSGGGGAPGGPPHPAALPQHLPPPHSLQHNQHHHHQHQHHQQHLNSMSPSHQQQMHINMANMAAITQPVTNTILPPADSRANVPIYQQQR